MKSECDSLSKTMTTFKKRIGASVKNEVQKVLNI